MQEATEKIKELFSSCRTEELLSIERLPLSGSDRIYYRILTTGPSFIATQNNNARENETFFYFTEQFRSKAIPVANVICIDESRCLYLQEDFGDSSLLNELEHHGYNEYVYELYRQSLRELARMQISGDSGLDYSRCITSREFGKQAIITDLLYFKYYFLDTLKIPYDKDRLGDDFEAFGNYLSHVDEKFFMFRDFQSRNIMVKEGQVHFIDYQGGMKGALQYDVASMLWQAKAMLSIDWKNNLFSYYMDCVEELLGHKLDRARFESQYNGYVLIRLLQVLGAYGFRGLFERKAHFLTSIPLALKNLKWFLENKQTGIVLPEFSRILSLIVTDEVIERFEPLQATDETPLVVKVKSFSYKISGVPKDDTPNGGGFVFDCRGILNPGRIEKYKQVNGRNKPVKDYLEQQTRMPDFLNSVYNILDIAVEDYINRKFDSLMVSFGCTGGCHRSVYAADAVVRHLRNKFGVKVELEHVEQGIKEFFPPMKIN